MTPYFSIVIPVFNRPEEVRELLESLTKQTYKNFEVVIVEDGSTNDSKKEVDSFRDQLEISYYFKENSGQGFSRNYGFERAKGEWFIVFDSDCIIPKDYFQIVKNYLEDHDLDAYGGPDAAHESFTPVQKAISYSMTSLFTTGGIRGGKKHIGPYHPRSFNMGISKEVFEKTKGYILPKKGEDIEFSIRIIESGFRTGLISDAYVYHKRRTNFRQFFKQLHFFGTARINIYRFFKPELKLVHFIPSFFFLGFVTGLVLLLLLPTYGKALLAFYGVYVLIILMHSLIVTKDAKVAFLSTIAAFVQLFAYGLGLISEGIKYLSGS